MRKGNSVKKYTVCSGRPILSVPADHMAYCDAQKYPVIIIWKRARYADVTWLNEPFQRSHGWLWQRDDFRADIEERGETIFRRYNRGEKSARAIQHSMMTLYDLTITGAEQAASDLFDMTLSIVAEYQERRENATLIDGDTMKVFSDSRSKADVYL